MLLLATGQAGLDVAHSCRIAPWAQNRKAPEPERTYFNDSALVSFRKCLPQACTMLWLSSHSIIAVEAHAIDRTDVSNWIFDGA